MNWTNYKKTITHIAKTSFEYDDVSLESMLSYAKRLWDRNLPILFDQNHLALKIGYKYDYLLSISNSQSHFYREFQIPKSNQGFRTIHEPLTSLKEIQRWILDNILNKMPLHPAAKAYRTGYSIKDAARFHIGQHVLMKLDIKDFFGSIKETSVVTVFQSHGYSLAVSTLLAKLCCLDKALPQGSPTSPQVSNLVMYDIDDAIFRYCREHNIRYTRYADDMIFSGQFTPFQIKLYVKRILKKNRLYLNEAKFHVAFGHKRQEVTGIVVNRKMQVTRAYRNLIRQEVYYLRRFGLDNVTKWNSIESPAKYIDGLKGKISHAAYINPRDKKLKEYLVYICRLSSDFYSH